MKKQLREALDIEHLPRHSSNISKKEFYGNKKKLTKPISILRIGNVKPNPKHNV